MALVNGHREVDMATDSATLNIHRKSTTAAALDRCRATSPDLVVIPKSTHREGIEENARIFDFTLSEQDMAALDALDRTNATDRMLERRSW